MMAVTLHGLALILLWDKVIGSATCYIRSQVDS